MVSPSLRAGRELASLPLARLRTQSRGRSASSVKTGCELGERGSRCEVVDRQASRQGRRRASEPSPRAADIRLSGTTFTSSGAIVGTRRSTGSDRRRVGEPPSARRSRSSGRVPPPSQPFASSDRPRLHAVDYGVRRLKPPCSQQGTNACADGQATIARRSQRASASTPITLPLRAFLRLEPRNRFTARRGRVADSVVAACYRRLLARVLLRGGACAPVRFSRVGLLALPARAGHIGAGHGAVAQGRIGTGQPHRAPAPPRDVAVHSMPFMPGHVGSHQHHVPGGTCPRRNGGQYGPSALHHAHAGCMSAGRSGARRPRSATPWPVDQLGLADLPGHQART